MKRRNPANTDDGARGHLRALAALALYGILGGVASAEAAPSRAGLAWILHEEPDMAVDELNFDRLMNDAIKNPFAVPKKNRRQLPIGAPLDGDPTSFAQALRNALDTEPDEIFLLFTSHGQPASEDSSGYLETGSGKVYYRDLFRVLLTELAESRRPVTINMIIASCYSGSAIDELEAQLARAPSRAFRINILTSASASRSSTVLGHPDVGSYIYPTFFEARSLLETFPKTVQFCKGCETFQKAAQLATFISEKDDAEAYSSYRSLNMDPAVVLNIARTRPELRARIYQSLIRRFEGPPIGNRSAHERRARDAVAENLRELDAIATLFEANPVPNRRSLRAIEARVRTRIGESLALSTFLAACQANPRYAETLVALLRPSDENSGFERRLLAELPSVLTIEDETSENPCLRALTPINR